MEEQTESYHCNKQHGRTPCKLNHDHSTTTIGVCDTETGLFDYYMRGRSIDMTLNHLGRAVFPPIETLTEADRWETHSVLIAPSLFMQLLPDSVIAVCRAPTGPAGVRPKR